VQHSEILRLGIYSIPHPPFCGKKNQPNGFIGRNPQIHGN
jgi:hypothetical protein